MGHVDFPEDALCLLWKPRGALSQGYLGDFKRSRALSGKPREGIGHTGTLDPFAEGLLLVGIGEGLKLMHPLLGLPKTYIARMTFGLSSDTLDNLGVLKFWEPFVLADCEIHTLDQQLAKFLSAKRGPFEQVPPKFSAIKVDGQRSYELARKGIEAPPLAARPAEILRAEHFSVYAETQNGKRLIHWDFKIEVSSGTYIRALARDWGRELFGEEAALSGLVRTAIGPFTAAESDCPKLLGRKDLEPCFQELVLTQELLEPFLSSGRRLFDCQSLDPRKHTLVLDQEHKLRATLEARTHKTGRVFLKSPI